MCSRIETVENSNILIESIRNNDLIEFRKIIKLYNLDTSYKDDISILLAVQNNNPEMVKSLLKNKNTNPCVNYGQPLQDACKNGYYDVFLLLINHTRVVKYNLYYSFSLAITHGHTKIAKHLFDHYKSNIINKLLLNNNLVLKNSFKVAFENKKNDTLLYLFSISEIREQIMKEKDPEYDRIKAFCNIHYF